MTKRKPTTPKCPEQIIAAHDAADIALHSRLRRDPVEFCIRVLGFIPNAIQERFLRIDARNDMRVMLSLSRQFGKSTIAAAYICWALFAFQGFRAFLFSPTGEQTAQVFEKVVHWFKTSPYLARYAQHSVKGDTLTIGGPDWDSRCELVRCGLTGSLARGRSTNGNGLILLDEFAQFLYLNETLFSSLASIVASGGGIVLLSSPGEVGTDAHTVYENWKELATANDRYHVLEGSYADCDHISAAFIDDMRATMPAYIFERELGGKWNNRTAGYFNLDHIKRCVEPVLPRPKRDDPIVIGCDAGGLGKHSKFTICISRYSPSLSRLEIIDLRVFKFKNERYHTDTSGVEVLTSFRQLREVIEDIRLQYRNVVYFGYDPANEKSMFEEWENSGLPMHPVLIGGYQAKVSALTQIERALAERRIVWTDKRIAQELEQFSPQTCTTTGRLIFREAGFDILTCLNQLIGYLGARELPAPFAVSVGCRVPEAGALW